MVEEVVVQEGMGQMLATMGLGEGIHRHIALVCLLLTSKRPMRGKVGRGRKFVLIRIERICPGHTHRLRGYSR